MSHRPFKDRLYAEFATIGKALASAHRLELLDLLGQGERSVDELAQEIGQPLANTSAHLQALRGARSIPVAELERRLAEVPRDREVVAYCRGPYCVYSDEAAELLQRKGFRVRRFAEGFPEWRAAGLPVEANGGIALEEHH